MRDGQSLLLITINDKNKNKKLVMKQIMQFYNNSNIKQLLKSLDWVRHCMHPLCIMRRGSNLHPRSEIFYVLINSIKRFAWSEPRWVRHTDVFVIIAITLSQHEHIHSWWVALSKTQHLVLLLSCCFFPFILLILCETQGERAVVLWLLCVYRLSSGKLNISAWACSK